MAEIEDIAHRCAAALRRRPSGLLTDIDGTISLIAQTPDAAVVSDHARDALERIARRIDITGAITGRAAENAERMVGLPGLVYIGNHGLEHRVEGATAVHADVAHVVADVSAAVDSVRAAAEQAGLLDGILYEYKGVTSSIHYRLAADPVDARAILVPLVTSAAAERGLKVVEGRMVIEIRPAVSINKGTALRELIARHRLRGLVFLGDDVTDIDAFDALIEARGAGTLRGLNVAVVAAESNPLVAERADAAVIGVDACIAMLHQVADLFDATPGDES